MKTAATKLRSCINSGATDKIRKVLSQCHGLPISTPEIAILIGLRGEHANHRANALLAIMFKRGEITKAKQRSHAPDSQGRFFDVNMWRLAK
jgi:hypothetical protein